MGPTAPDDPLGLAGLGDMFGDDTFDEVLFGEDSDGEDSDDDDYDDLLTIAAATVGRATGTTPVEVDVARASVFGFDERLAAVVLADDELLRQLTRHWARQPISAAVRALADQPTPLGRLHADLIRRAGPSAQASAGGQVIVGPWTYRPRLAHRRAARSVADESNSFSENRDDWGLRVVQTAQPNGDAVIELIFAPGAAEDLWLVRVVAGGQDRVLLCRVRGAELVARTVVGGADAWRSNDVYRPVPADSAPPEVLARIPDSVRAAPIAETNLWRRLRRRLPDGHRVAVAIDAGLA